MPGSARAMQFFRDIQDVGGLRNEMRQMRVKTQHLFDILSATEEDDTGAYKGNEYRTYRKAVNAINAKYNASAKWGVMQTGSIIDLRAAFIISQGIKVSAREKNVDASKEIKWTNAFLEYNDLDKEMIQEFAKEAEIEGKILIKIDVDETDKLIKYKEYDYKMVSARYVSWIDKGYEVETEEDDYRKYKSVTWEGKKPGKLEKDIFIYKKFGGRLNEPNIAQPKIMKCLTQIDNLDKALRDWREINRIFAGPILYYKANEVLKESVTKALEALDNKNLKIKKILAGYGELSYSSFDIKGVESLENEIFTNAKMISGTTGVSVQYLGLVELLKNRSTGDDQRETLSLSTTKERKVWEGAYEELITKAMNLFNKEVYGSYSEEKKLKPSLIKVNIPVVTKEHWANIKDVWLPAALAGKISDDLFLEQLPDIDIEEEKKRRKEKEESELEEAKKENEDLKTDRMDKELFGKNNKGEEE